jgi:hypothetical protein
MGWSGEKDEFLLALCKSAEALSAAKIAARLSDRFGETISRQAVIGRAKRLSVPLPRSERSPAPVPDEKPTTPPALVQRPKVTYVPPPLPKERMVLVEDQHEIGVLLINAAERDCRFPLNDPVRGRMIELRVCGEPAVKGRYCAACYEKLYLSEV